MIQFAAARSILGTIGNKIPWRWVLLAAGSGGASLLAARFIDEVFVFARWAQIAAVAAVCAFFVWELACLHYTGKIDIPGDGKRPVARP